MTRAVAAAIIVASLAATTAVGRRQEALRAPANTVWVTATVTDHFGRLVPDLGRDDFDVRDNGKPAIISIYQNDVLPFALVVMFDVSGSMKDNFPLMRSAAEQMIGKLALGDRMLFGSFAGQAHVDTRFAANTRKLKAGIASALAGQSAMDCVFDDNSIGRGRPGQSPLIGKGGTALWDGVACGVRAAFSDSEAPRRAVVVITDGGDNASHMNDREAKMIANGDGIMVYAIGAAGSEGLLGSPLRKLANETGGGFIEIKPKQWGRLAPILDGVIEELHHQYVFGFVPPVEDGRSHRIEVTVRRDGMTVRARQNYLAESAR